MLLLLLLLWPVAELLVAIQVAHLIGVLETIVLLIITWPLGSWALRSQGRAAWQRLSAAVAAGRRPGREVLDGALVLAGGLLLIVPGFITDVVGLVLLAPPTRALSRSWLARNLQSRFVVRATQVGRQPYDVDSTAHEVDQPRLRP
jgi:UPF0716 protein FxsA